MAVHVHGSSSRWSSRRSSIAAALRVAVRAVAAAVVVSLGSGAAPALADLPIRSSIETGTWGSCGLTASGDGLCWGYTDFTGEPPAVGGPAGRSYQSPVPLASISIDPGNANSCVVNVAGRAWCWKNLWGGALAPPDTTFQSVSAGSDFNCGVTSGWDALCWGSNTYGQLGTGGHRRRHESIKRD